MSREKKYKILYVLSRIFGFPKRLFLSMFNQYWLIIGYGLFILVSQFLTMFLSIASEGWLNTDGWIFRHSILEIGWQILRGILYGVVTAIFSWSEWAFYPLALFICIAILTGISFVINGIFGNRCNSIRNAILKEQYIPLIDKVLAPGDNGWIAESPKSADDEDLDAYWSADPVASESEKSGMIWVNGSQGEGDVSLVAKYWEAAERNTKTLESNRFAPEIDPFVKKISAFSRFYDKRLSKAAYFVGVIFFFFAINWTFPHMIKTGYEDLQKIDLRGITLESLSKMPNADYKKVENRDLQTPLVWGCVYDFRLLSDYDTWESYMCDYRIGASKTATIFRDGRFFSNGFYLPGASYYLTRYVYGYVYYNEDFARIYEHQWKNNPSVIKFNHNLLTLQVITYTIAFYLLWAVMLACVFPALFGHADIEEFEFQEWMKKMKKRFANRLLDKIESLK